MLGDKYSQRALDLINQPVNSKGVGNKLRTYAKFKKSISLEYYLISNLSWTKKRIITKFRTSDHKLKIEVGRHCRPRLPPEQRLCVYCDQNKTEDEVHFIMECPKYNALRVRYNIVKNNEDNLANFITLFTTEDYDKLNNLAEFIKEALALRESLSTKTINNILNSTNNVTDVVLNDTLVVQ